MDCSLLCCLSGQKDPWFFSVCALPHTSHIFTLLPSPLSCLREKSEVFKKQRASLSASSCPPLVEGECRTPGEFSRLLHLLFGMLPDIFLDFFHHQKQEKAHADFHLKLRFIHYINCILN